MKKILVTGATGFVGTGLVKELSSKFAVTGTYCTQKPTIHEKSFLHYRQMDLSNEAEVQGVCNDCKADIVIHAAAVTERSHLPARLRRYQSINGEGTERLARSAAYANPAVHFIYLSTTAVYGESSAAIPVGEDHSAHPSTEYARSKYRGERELVSLNRDNILRTVTVLRLSPLYDRDDTRILSNRVRAPRGSFFVRYGTGRQLFSALALSNLSDFISFLVLHRDSAGLRFYNVCDERPYRFNEVRETMRRRTPVDSTCIWVPRGLVYTGVVVAGVLRPHERRRFLSYYRKLFNDLVFDCGRMRETGFNPAHTVETVFSEEGSNA